MLYCCQGIRTIIIKCCWNKKFAPDVGTNAVTETGGGGAFEENYLIWNLRGQGCYY